MDILTLLNEPETVEEIRLVVGNPRAQLGRNNKPYLGLQLMPERIVEENSFTEDNIFYQTVIANDGTPYSTPQLKESVITGSFDVKLISSDIASQFKAQVYEVFIKLLRRAQYSNDEMGMQALIRLLDWVDISLNLPLIEKNERRIWENLVDAEVQVEGDGGFKKSIPISNPPGSRVNAGDWADLDYPVLDDIYGRANYLKDKGFNVYRQIAPDNKIQQLCRHPKLVKEARAFISIGENGELQNSTNRLTVNGLNAFFAENELPPVESYNKTYKVQGGASRHFLKRDAWVFVGETDLTEEYVLEDGDILTIENTLGYSAVGRNMGYPDPGRMVHLDPISKGKAPHIDGEGWQESFCVNQNPEAVSALKQIPNPA